MTEPPPGQVRKGQVPDVDHPADPAHGALMMRLPKGTLRQLFTASLFQLRKLTIQTWKATAALSAVIGLFSMWSIYPSLSIEPAVTTNSQAPFATRFYLQNLSLYSLNEWHYACYLKPFLPAVQRHVMLATVDQDVYPGLIKNGKSSVRCSFQSLDDKLLDRAILIVVVFFRIQPWPIPLERSAAFFLKRDELDHHAMWLPMKSGDSSVEAINFLRQTPVP